jgi:hypothetical protein
MEPLRALYGAAEGSYPLRALYKAAEGSYPLRALFSPQRNHSAGVVVTSMRGLDAGDFR